MKMARVTKFSVRRRMPLNAAAVLLAAALGSVHTGTARTHEIGLVSSMADGRQRANVSDVIFETSVDMRQDRARPGVLSIRDQQSDSSPALAAARGALTPYLIKDIVPGNGSSGPHELTPFGGKLFFSASDGTSGFELCALQSTMETTFERRWCRPSW